MIGGLTWTTLLAAAAVDSINPCTLAILLILLSTLLIAGKKEKILGAGIAFTSAIYISYFLMGLGIYSAVQATGFLHIFYYIIIVIALIVGVLSIRGYFNYKPGFLAVEIPMKWRPKMKRLIGNVNSIPGAAFVGFFCSLFLLPCSSGPYFVILGLLAKTSTKLAATPLLLLYNFIFILPMIIMTLLTYLGMTSVEQVSSWREKYIKIIHLISGIIMLILAIILLYAIYVVWV